MNTPIKNRSGFDRFTANPPVGPHPVEGWHGPLKGPIRPLGSDPSNHVASWSEGEWDFTGWEGSAEAPYLVRKGTALAVELGLEKGPLPYPDHTPPEPPSPWHRWEYRGENVAGLEPPWYAASLKRRAPSVIEDRVSTGFYTEYYFQAVTDVPLICVNGIWFPEPCREPLGRGQRYFVVAPDYGTGRRESVWYNDNFDNQWLAAGLIHLTPEAAAAHARAMRSLALERGANTAMEQEVTELRGWKESQLNVEKSWDPQAVAASLGFVIGTDILPNILPAIEKMKTTREDLERQLTHARNVLSRILVDHGGGLDPAVEREARDIVNP